MLQTEMTKTKRQTKAEKKREQELHAWKNHTFPALRLMRGKSTAQVARDCGLAWGTVANIRQLKTTAPRFETISRIVTAYGGRIRVEYD